MTVFCISAFLHTFHARTHQTAITAMNMLLTCFNEKSFYSDWNEIWVGLINRRGINAWEIRSFEWHTTMTMYSMFMRLDWRWRVFFTYLFYRLTIYLIIVYIVNNTSAIIFLHGINKASRARYIRKKCRQTQSRREASRQKEGKRQSTEKKP